jgi:hypothetical protein
MNAHTGTIADPQQAYPPTHPPTQFTFDRQTDNLFQFIGACEKLRRRYHDDLDAQVKQATGELAERHTRQGRPGGMAGLVEAARRQVYWQRRRLADVELRGMHPTGRLLEHADACRDVELYRRRERALELLLGQDGIAYDHLAPQVLADRESACRQQALLVDEQAAPTRQLNWLRGLLGLFGQRHARQLGRDLAELDRQLQQVQAEIAWQQALLDAIQTIDANRAEWLTKHQEVLLEGAAAVIVLTRRLLALANPPGCPSPITTVDLDNPMGEDPLTQPTTNGTASNNGSGDGDDSGGGGGARSPLTSVARGAVAGLADPPRPS